MKSQRNAATWLWLAYALLILSCLRDVGNPDVFWHLSAGQRMLSSGRLPAQDWLSFTRAGAPWIDFEWLSQLALTLTYRLAGWWGLVALKTAVIVSAAALIERALAARGIGPDERACGVAVLAAAWLISNDVRPDWLSVLLLCGELVALEAMRARRWRWGAGATGAAAVGAGAFWANCHAGFVAGLGVAALYVLLAESPARGPAAALGGGLLAGTFLTPFGPRLYDVLWLHSRLMGEMTRDILEWGRTSLFNPWAAPVWLLAAGCALAAWAAPPRRREWPAWAALASLGAMAFLHQRHIPYFAVAGVLLPPILLQERVGFALPRACAAANVVLGLIFVLALRFPLTRSGLDDGGQPRGPAAYLRAHPEVASLRLYNPWGCGGYLGWSVPPPYRVYFDGRYIFHDLLDPELTAERSPAAWSRFMDAQGLDGGIFSRTGPVPPPAEWAVVYADKAWVIDVRRHLAVGRSVE